MTLQLKRTTEEALIDAQQKFVTCKVGSKTEDPGLWCDKLKVINNRLGGIDRQCRKGDIEMMSRFMTYLPNKNSKVVTILKVNGIASKMIDDLRLAVRDMWKRALESKTKKKSAEHSLNTGHKKFSKEFKGDCGYCGKQGHKKELASRIREKIVKKEVVAKPTTPKEEQKEKSKILILFVSDSRKRNIQHSCILIRTRKLVCTH
jgi:hypothetical protein